MQPWLRNTILALFAAALLGQSGASASPSESSARWMIRDLGTLPGRPFSTALGINEAGQIVGWSAYQFGRDKQFIDCHVVLWEGARTVDISANQPSGCDGALNDRGQLAFNAGAHAFLWAKGTTTPLGSLPGETTSSAKAINNAGVIIGDSWVGSPGFIWSDGRMTNLGSLGAE